MATISNNSAVARRISLGLILACLGLCLICIGYPMYVIRPFQPQGARELAAALLVLRYRIPITLLCALAACASLLVYWRAESGKGRRVISATCAGLVGVLAVLAWVNIYELMFHPIGQPSFAVVSQVKLDKAEKVIAVKIGGSARAYPIRIISYHHLVNDTVGKVAIIATY